MHLNPQQLERFQRDGYLVFPELFSWAEIAVLRAETARLARIEAEAISALCT